MGETKNLSPNRGGIFSRILPSKSKGRSSRGDRDGNRSMSPPRSRPASNMHDSMGNHSASNGSYSGTFLDRDLQKDSIKDKNVTLSPAFFGNNWWKLPDTVSNRDIKKGKSKKKEQGKTKNGGDPLSRSSEHTSIGQLENLSPSLPRTYDCQTLLIREDGTRSKSLKIFKSTLSEDPVATVNETDFKEMKLVDNDTNDELAKVVELHGGGTRYKIYAMRPMFTGQASYGPHKIFPWAQVKDKRKPDEEWKFEMTLSRFKGKEVKFIAQDFMFDGNNNVSGFQICLSARAEIAAKVSYMTSSNGKKERSVFVSEIGADPSLMILFMAIVESYL